ncbi:MAG TPA: M56 family metallopeptidase [Gemmatimonadaceae bacterium]|jgi:beta-lactamase regulating signal transducer with metallopeptidase domain
MTLAWMIFGMLVSLVVVFAASAAASALRLVGKPTRWIWGVAIAAVFALFAGAPYRESSSVISLDRLPVASAAAAPIVAASAPSVLVRIRTGAATSFRDVVTAAVRLAPARINRYVMLAWSIASAALFLLLVAVYVRMRMARRVWSIVEVQGTTVRMSDNAGPAIVGLLRPEIVVPRWLLTRAPHEQRMALTHELEHVRVHDHLLLAAGCLAVVLMPWNPAVWWMFSRLRLAIELDCDARVLRQGTEPQSYGSLLIDLAEQSFGLRMGAPALVDGASHLQTRVMAMTKKTQRFARVRGSLVGLAAVSLLVVACEAKLPTSADIQQMDVASYEKAMTMATLKSGNATYLIDGASATSDQAHALRPDQIVGINVSQSGNGSVGQIVDIRTVNGPKRVALRADTATAMIERDKVRSYASNIMAGDSAVRAMKMRKTATSGFTGLLVIDGKITDPSAMQKLNPKDIDRIDVLKGPAAMAEYNDPRAANGVIVIKMKNAAP